MNPMTPSEYRDQLKALEENFENDKKKLARDFALSNNPYKIGDLITDHIGTIKIAVIKWTYNYQDNPSCRYYGSELKKDLTPKANRKLRTVCQEHVVKLEK